MADRSSRRRSPQLGARLSQVKRCHSDCVAAWQDVRNNPSPGREESCLPSEAAPFVLGKGASGGRATCHHRQMLAESCTNGALGSFGSFGSEVLPAEVGKVLGRQGWAKDWQEVNLQNDHPTAGIPVLQRCSIAASCWPILWLKRRIYESRLDKSRQSPCQPKASFCQRDEDSMLSPERCCHWSVARRKGP